MPARIQIGSISIQRVVEQEAPFFDALQFFPTLTNDLLAENRAWLTPKFLDAEDKLVLCMVAARRADSVNRPTAFDDLVALTRTPGQPIDHYSVRVGKPGADAVITGDMIRSPLQARYPELSARPDYDGKQSAQTRRKLFGELCDTSTLVCTAHFPSPSVGRLVRWRDAFDFVAM